jgi:phosphatidylglycerophosphate synthase
VSVALERIDPLLVRLLAPATRRLGRVDPNSVTWLGTGMGLAAALVLWRAPGPPAGSVWLVVSAGAIAVSYLLDVLDGTVARAHGRTTAYGDFLDHTLDRVVDTALLLAIAHNTAWFADSRLGLWAVVGMLLGSYMGTQARSSGLSRDLSGFSRTDRLALLVLGAVVSAVPLERPINGLAPAVVLVGVGGVYTFVHRAVRGRSALKGRRDPDRGSAE